MTEATQKQLKVGKEKGQIESKAVTKELSEIETRDLIRKYLHVDCDPKHILKSAAKQITLCQNEDPKEAKKGEKALLENADKYLMALGIGNHYALAETIDGRYRPLIIEFARQIEKEYDCRTPSEIVLVEAIAGAYARIIQYSKKLECCTRVEYLSNEKNGYYTMLSKELDRAHRHLINGLSTLKQIKSPTIEVQVKAKTAFIAQNQQINTSDHLKPQTSETNESK